MRPAAGRRQSQEGPLRQLGWFGIALTCCLASLSVTRPAQGAVIERVVAVVGERAILLSDLRARAEPFLLRVYRELPPGARRTAAISQLHKMLLERMIDEELEQRAAARAQIKVTSAEIDQAITRIAAQNNLTPQQVIAEAGRSGMNEAEYRREVRRQVLDAKMLSLRLQGRIRITEEDLRSAYRKMVMDERRRLRHRAAWIVLDAPQTASNRSRKTQRALAERIAARARGGADFAALARRYSKDPRTRAQGGLLGRMTLAQLPAAVARTVLRLQVGQVSVPVRDGDRIVIVKLVERDESSLPTFENAVRELHERVYMEKMQKARRHWLDGLRRRTHVEVRL
jgi:peptidyl-prolyl cis-trans isomerase SurA